MATLEEVMAKYGLGQTPKRFNDGDSSIGRNGAEERVVGFDAPEISHPEQGLAAEPGSAISTQLAEDFARRPGTRREYLGERDAYNRELVNWRNGDTTLAQEQLRRGLGFAMDDDPKNIQAFRQGLAERDNPSTPEQSKINAVLDAEWATATPNYHNQSKTKKRGALDVLGDAWDRGVDTFGLMAGGTEVLAGQMLGLDALEKDGRERIRKNQIELSYNEPDIGTLEKAETVGDHVTWALEKLGEQGPNLLGMIGAGIATGGLGSAAGVAGTALEASASAVGRLGAEKLAARAAINALGVANKALSAELGAAAAGATLNIGESKLELEKVDPTGDHNLLALGTGLVKTGLDVYSLRNMPGAGRLMAALGKQKGLTPKEAMLAWGDIPIEVLKSTLREGTTEGLQTVLDEAAKQYQAGTDINWSNIKESAAAGALVGGVAAIPGGLAEAGINELNKKTETPPQAESPIPAHLRGRPTPPPPGGGQRGAQPPPPGGTTPEPMQDLDAQIRAAADPADPRKVVYAAGNDADVRLRMTAAGLRVRDISDGVESGLLASADPAILDQAEERLRSGVSVREVNAELLGLPDKDAAVAAPGSRVVQILDENDSVLKEAVVAPEQYKATLEQFRAEAQAQNRQVRILGVEAAQARRARLVGRERRAVGEADLAAIDDLFVVDPEHGRLVVRPTAPPATPFDAPANTVGEVLGRKRAAAGSFGRIYAEALRRVEALETVVPADEAARRSVAEELRKLSSALERARNSESAGTLSEADALEALDRRVNAALDRVDPVDRTQPAFGRVIEGDGLPVQESRRRLPDGTVISAADVEPGTRLGPDGMAEGMTDAVTTPVEPMEDYAAQLREALAEQRAKDEERSGGPRASTQPREDARDADGAIIDRASYHPPEGGRGDGRIEPAPFNRPRADARPTSSVPPSKRRAVTRSIKDDSPIADPLTRSAQHGERQPNAPEDRGAGRERLKKRLASMPWVKRYLLLDTKGDNSMIILRPATSGRPAKEMTVGERNRQIINVATYAIEKWLERTHGVKPEERAEGTPLGKAFGYLLHRVASNAPDRAIEEVLRTMASSPDSSLFAVNRAVGADGNYSRAAGVRESVPLERDPYDDEQPVTGEEYAGTNVLEEQYIQEHDMTRRTVMSTGTRDATIARALYDAGVAVEDDVVRDPKTGAQTVKMSATEQVRALRTNPLMRAFSEAQIAAWVARVMKAFPNDRTIIPAIQRADAAYADNWNARMEEAIAERTDPAVPSPREAALQIEWEASTVHARTWSDPDLDVPIEREARYGRPSAEEAAKRDAEDDREIRKRERERASDANLQKWRENRGDLSEEDLQQLEAAEKLADERRLRGVEPEQDAQDARSRAREDAMMEAPVRLDDGNYDAILPDGESISYDPETWLEYERGEIEESNRQRNQPGWGVKPIVTALRRHFGTIMDKLIARGEAGERGGVVVVRDLADAADRFFRLTGRKLRLSRMQASKKIERMKWMEKNSLSAAFVRQFESAFDWNKIFAAKTDVAQRTEFEAQLTRIAETYIDRIQVARYSWRGRKDPVARRLAYERLVGRKTDFSRAVDQLADHPVGDFGLPSALEAAAQKAVEGYMEDAQDTYVNFFLSNDPTGVFAHLGSMASDLSTEIVENTRDAVSANIVRPYGPPFAEVVSEILLIMDTVIRSLPDRDLQYLPQPIDEDARSDVYNTILAGGSGGLPYHALVDRARRSATEAKLKSLDTTDGSIRRYADPAGGGEWVTFFQGKADPKILNQLAHRNWCTGRSLNMAKGQLASGDFHIYMKNGAPQLAVRMVDDSVGEIQGPANNGSIPVGGGRMLQALLDVQDPILSDEQRRILEEAVAKQPTREERINMPWQDQLRNLGFDVVGEDIYAYDAIPDSLMVKLLRLHSLPADDLPISVRALFNLRQNLVHLSGLDSRHLDSLSMDEGDKTGAERLLVELPRLQSIDTIFYRGPNRLELNLKTALPAVAVRTLSVENPAGGAAEAERYYGQQDGDYFEREPGLPSALEWHVDARGTELGEILVRKWWGQTRADYRPVLNVEIAPDQPTPKIVGDRGSLRISLKRRESVADSGIEVLTPQFLHTLRKSGFKRHAVRDIDVLNIGTGDLRQQFNDGKRAEYFRRYQRDAITDALAIREWRALQGANRAAPGTRKLNVHGPAEARRTILGVLRNERSELSEPNRAFLEAVLNAPSDYVKAHATGHLARYAGKTHQILDVRPAQILRAQLVPLFVAAVEYRTKGMTAAERATAMLGLFELGSDAMVEAETRERQAFQAKRDAMRAGIEAAKRSDNPDVARWAAEYDNTEADGPTIGSFYDEDNLPLDLYLDPAYGYDDDIPFSVQRSDVQGFYDPQSGLTFLIANALTGDTAAAVLAHEATHGAGRKDVDAAAMRLLKQRGTQTGAVRELLDAVQKRMQDAEVEDKDSEASAYIVEEAMLRGRQAGYSAVDGRFMSWVDRTFGKRVGRVVRDFVAMVRAWLFKRGTMLKATDLRIDDMVALVNFDLRDMAQADTDEELAGLPISASEGAPRETPLTRRQTESRVRSIGAAMTGMAKAVGSFTLYASQPMLTSNWQLQLEADRRFAAHFFRPKGGEKYGAARAAPGAMDRALTEESMFTQQFLKALRDENGKAVDPEMAAEAMLATERARAEGKTVEQLAAENPLAGRLQEFFRSVDRYVRGAQTRGYKSMDGIYLPQLTEIAEIQARPDDFIAFLSDPENDFKYRDPLTGKEEQVTEDVARVIVRNMLNSHRHAEHVDIPFAGSLMARVLTSPHYQRLAREAGWLRNDPGAIIPYYIRSITRLTEFERRFGGHIADPHTGETVSFEADDWRLRRHLMHTYGIDLFDNERYRLALRRAVEDGWITPYPTKSGTTGFAVYQRDQQYRQELNRALQKYGNDMGRRRAAKARIQKIVTGYMGALGADMNPAWRKSQQWISVMQTLTVLSFSAVSSLPEAAIQVARAPKMGDLWEAIKVIAKDKDSTRKLMEDLGYGWDSIINVALLDNSGYHQMEGMPRKIIDKFFLYNGQHHWTYMMRAFALQTGIATFRRAARENDEAFLRQFGLTPDQVRMWDRGGQPQRGAAPGAVIDTVQGATHPVVQALHAFISERVVLPDAGTRPVWANDPRFQLLAALKGFLYGYGQVVVGGMLRTAARNYHAAVDRGDSKGAALIASSVPFLVLGGLSVPLAMIAGELKDKLKYDLWGQTRPQFQEPEGLAWTWMMLRKTGVFGPFEPAVALFDENSHGISALLGPAAGHLEVGLEKGFFSEEFLRRSTPVLNQMPGFWMLVEDDDGL